MKFYLPFFISVFLAHFYSFSQVNHWETVVYESDNWKYLIPNSPVSSTWNTIGFNASSWSNGQGGFGYGDGDDNTTFSSALSCYQRINFVITDINAIDQVVLNIDYDDAFVAYLNGVEITRDNISSVGQPSYDQSSDGFHEAVMYNGGYPLQYLLPSSLISNNLTSGTNVLAVQVHNESINSSDMSSRIWLSLGINNTSNDYGTTPGWFIPPFVFTDSNLPIVVINTAGGVAIPDTPKLDATMGIINNGAGNRNYMTDPFNEYRGNIGIEIRGSSSSTFPKKQWGFETRTPSGESNDVSIFNMAYDNDWILYAPYSDKSLIRNVLTYKMGWDTEHFAPRTQLCEVVLNGEYQGVYVLTEKIKRKDGKVGINSVESNENQGNELTGDYIIKIDKIHSGEQAAWASPFPPYPGASISVKYQMHSPSYDSITATQLNYIQTKITDFEQALAGPSFTDPINGYAPYIDMESFIDFLLVNEFGRNVDGYRISTYLNKRRDSEGGKIYAGPLWDFNLAFGNANYCSGGNIDGWAFNFYTQCSGDPFQAPFWWNRFIQDPEFIHQLNCRWQTLRNGPWKTDSLMNQIDSLANVLGEAQSRNFQKWPTLGTWVWPNNFVGNSYEEEIAFLKQWIASRADWMDANMFGLCADLGVGEMKKNKIEVYPNPANSEVFFSWMDEVKDGSIELINNLGQIVRQTNILNQSELKIMVGNFAPGIYQYKITLNSREPVIGKLIIQ